ncbi:MAG: hypothetical protein KY393_04925 [Actinobacteria bacterium]|nr:hypothetical protein [Actinomycetota bacterium]
MADTGDMPDEQNTGDMPEGQNTGDEDQSGEPDFETIEPKEDDNPHFQAFHDPPDPEDAPES